MAKRFERTREDFVCRRCGHEVQGTGYTNHCPKCLWSRHVDVQPGDRAHGCAGMMRPTAVEVRGGGQVIVHRCERCGFTRRNKVTADDDFEVLLEVMRSAGGQSDA